MKNRLIVLIAFALTSVAARSEGLSLNQYLEQVRSHNPEARAAVESVNSFELRTREAEAVLSPELYLDYNLRDDKKPQLVPLFQGTETRLTEGKIGVRDKTSFGLNADVSFQGQRTNVGGVNGAFFPTPDYFESTAMITLTQNLWRNGFGEGTRAQVEADKAKNDTNLMQARFNLKTIMLNAQNAYWAAVSYDEIVKLQQENVDRAKKLRDYMTRRTRMKLFDDTDELQAVASFESRALELQSSLDDRAQVGRQINTLRGVSSDEVNGLDPLPAQDMMVSQAKASDGGAMTREDFEMLRAEARANVAQAKYAKSQIAPQLDIKGSYATNGLDGITQLSVEQAETLNTPTWTIGINFSVPLDFGLINNIRKGYRAAGLAADAANEQATFSETRAWDDLVKQKREAQGRYERSLSVEKIQADLVKRERRRLLDGRATTFESITFEQNLALAQIQRVRAQLALMQIHNAIKTFEVKK